MTRAVKIARSIRELTPGKSRRANAPRCAKCPVYALGWCKITARHVAGNLAMCAYGRRKRMSEAAKKARGKKWEV